MENVDAVTRAQGNCHVNVKADGVMHGQAEERQ